MKICKGHDPIHEVGGTDVLVTIHDDGEIEVALRPGKDQTELAWGAPVTFADTASPYCPCGMAGCSDAAVAR